MKKSYIQIKPVPMYKNYYMNFVGEEFTIDNSFEDGNSYQIVAGNTICRITKELFNECFKEKAN